ncbi:hypothetical protein SUGI_1016620 [Cryptomeria japonica]|nr:hypothetical protein SUGI_1016620 [Cryptomeria japonica]
MGQWELILFTVNIILLLCLLLYVIKSVYYDGREHPLPKKVLKALPMGLYEIEEGAEERMECSICLSEVENGEIVRSLPNCHHQFHRECIDKWFAINCCCPLCKTQVTITQQSGTVPNGNNAFQDVERG